MYDDNEVNAISGWLEGEYGVDLFNIEGMGLRQCVRYLMNDYPDAGDVDMEVSDQCGGDRTAEVYALIGLIREQGE